MVFETQVLKKIPKSVRIGISDSNEKNNKSNEIKSWLKDYNIICYHSENTSCIDSLRSCKKEDLIKLLSFKNVHALHLQFKWTTRMKRKQLRKFLKKVEEKKLFLGEIVVHNMEFYLKSECDELNNRTENKIFIKENKEKFEEARNIFFKEPLLQLIEVIKINGILNEEKKYVLTQQALKSLSKLGEEKLGLVIEYGIENNCLKKENQNDQEMIILLSEEIKVKLGVNDEELLKQIIQLLKDSKKENEEGYLYVTKEYCLEKMKIGTTKLNKLVEVGLTKDLLRFDDIKTTKVVCYTQERRLATKHL